MTARAAILDLLEFHFSNPITPVPEEALVELLHPLGHERSTVEAAVDELLRHDWLDGSPSTRSLVAKRKLVELFETSRDRLYRRFSRPWDGIWYQILIPPQSNPSCAEDPMVARQLQWFGFGRYIEGVWLGVHDRLAELVAHFDDVDSDLNFDYLEVVSKNLVVDKTLARRVWDLDPINAEYEHFIATYATRLTDFTAEYNGPQHAFLELTEMTSSFRRFVLIDPILPSDLLPKEWSGRQAYQIFRELTAALEGAARQHVRTVVDDCLRGRAS